MSASPTPVDDLTPALLEGWQSRFVNRTLPYAPQQPDGTYRWVYEPCTAEILAAHLRGEMTLGLSSTDARGACRWLCLDADQPGTLPQLLTLRGALAERGFPGLVEASRRGGHLWVFFDRALPAVAACFAMAKALEAARAAGVEIPPHERYPDLPTSGGIGHAMRLPLGIHRKTGKRYPLFDAQGLPCAFTTLGRAVASVLDIPTVSAAWAEAQWKRYCADEHVTVGVHTCAHASRRVVALGARADDAPPVDDPAPAQAQQMDTRSAVMRWVDQEVSPLDLLAELDPATEMKRVGGGYLGWCPFHDDHAPDAAGDRGTPSFYVVYNARYGWSWRCLSSNCAHSEGPMRHSFRLFQELLQLDVMSAIRAALRWWPEARRNDASLPRKDDTNDTDADASDNPAPDR